MPEMWQVTYNGVTLYGPYYDRKKAEVIAERYQRGFNRIKDNGDHVEVKRFTKLEKDFDRRYDEAKRGNPQKMEMIMEQGYEHE